VLPGAVKSVEIRDLRRSGRVERKFVWRKGERKRQTKTLTESESESESEEEREGGREKERGGERGGDLVIAAGNKSATRERANCLFLHILILTDFKRLVCNGLLQSYCALHYVVAALLR